MYARSLFGGAPSKSKKSSSASSKSAPEHRLGAFHDEAPDAKGMNKAIHQVLKQANAFNASQTVGAGRYNEGLSDSYGLFQTRNPEAEPFKGDEIALISEDIMAWALRLVQVNTGSVQDPEYKYLLPNIAFFIADGDWQSVIESDDMARKIAAQLHLPGQEKPGYAMPYRGKGKAQPWEMSCCMEPFTTDQKNKLSQIRGLCVMQAYYELMRGIAGVPSYALCKFYKDRKPNAIRVRGQFQTHGDPQAYQNWLDALAAMEPADSEADYREMDGLLGGELTDGNYGEWGSRLECATWGHLPFIKHFKGDGGEEFADLAPEGTFKEATTVLPKGDYILDDSKKDTRGMHVAASKSGGPYGRYGEKGDENPNARFTHRGTGAYGRNIKEGRNKADNEIAGGDEEKYGGVPVLPEEIFKKSLRMVFDRSTRTMREDSEVDRATAEETKEAGRRYDLNRPMFRLAMVRKGRSDDRETAQSSSAAFSGDGRETFSSLDEPQLVGMKEAWERSAGARYKAVYRTDLLPPRGASRCIVMTKEQGRKKNLRIPECVIPASYGALGGEVGTMLVLGSPMLRPAQLRSRKSGTIALGALLDEQKKIAKKAGRGGDQESMKILEMAALTMKQVNNRGAVDGVITSMEALRDAKELAKEQNMKWNPRPARGAGHDHIARGDFKKLTMNKEGRDEAVELMLDVFGNEAGLAIALRKGQPLWGSLVGVEREGSAGHKWNKRLRGHANREARRYGLTEADAGDGGVGQDMDDGYLSQMKRRPSSSLVVLGLVPCSWSFCEYFVRDAPATIPVTLGQGQTSIIPLPMTNPIALWAHVDLFADRFGGKRKAKEFADFVQKQLAEATKSGNYERVQEVGRFIKSWVECQIKEQADGVPCEMDDAVLSTAGIEIRRPTDEKKFEFKNDRYVKKHLQDIHKKLAEFSSSTAESESELLRQQANEALATFQKLSESLQAKADGGRRSRSRVRDGEEFSDDVQDSLKASRRQVEQDGDGDEEEE